MRLDKYLKVTRIIKRRPLAKQIAEDNRIKINEKVAKPSAELEIGDVIEIAFAQKVVMFKVLDLKEHVKKDEAAHLYEVIKEAAINREE